VAAGIPLASLGPRVSHLAGDPFPEPQRVHGRLAGRVIYVDRFGNCITNLPAPPPDLLASTGTASVVEVAGRRLPLVRTYGEAPPGQAIAVTGSAGFIEVAVRNGSAARQLHIGVATE